MKVNNLSDEETPKPYRLIHGINPFYVDGKNLVMSDVDAAIYLEGGNGAEYPITVLDSSELNRIKCKLPSHLTNGTYTLVVKSRGGDAGGMLQKATLANVSYLDVPDPEGFLSAGSYPEGHAEQFVDGEYYGGEDIVFNLGSGFEDYNPDENMLFYKDSSMESFFEVSKDYVRYDAQAKTITLDSECQEIPHSTVGEVVTWKVLDYTKEITFKGESRA